jgi:hypothetical protein
MIGSPCSGIPECTAAIASTSRPWISSGNGGPMPAGLLDKTGVPVVLEGAIERRDDLLIFKVDGFVNGAGA